MVVRFILWSLVDTSTSIEELRAESLPPSPGAAQEVWFADEAAERWGAFAVFANPDDAAEPLPKRLRELLGKEPDVFELFETAS